MSNRAWKTVQAVQDAVQAALNGERVVWFHPKGSAPAGWVLEALTTAGVEIREVEP